MALAAAAELLMAAELLPAAELLMALPLPALLLRALLRSAS